MLETLRIPSVSVARYSVQYRNLPPLSDLLFPFAHGRYISDKPLHIFELTGSGKSIAPKDR
jgi:hypothetical protein